MKKTGRYAWKKVELKDTTKNELRKFYNDLTDEEKLELKSILNDWEAEYERECN